MGDSVLSLKASRNQPEGFHRKFGPGSARDGEKGLGLVSYGP
jgi:hypothetical protein